MVSAEGERVRFDRSFECDGPVEEWLDGLIDTICDTVRSSIADAYAAFREVARSRWVETYPTQALLVASQAWWAVDVETAFGKMEGGHEAAMAELLAEVRTARCPRPAPARAFAQPPCLAGLR